MTARLAGVWIESGSSLPALEQRLHASLEEYGTPTVSRAGSLNVASIPPVESFRDESVLCILGGRLDNHRSLADELGLDPSVENAELVARAHCRFGEDALARLRGRFVVALWDSRAARGVLAVDQLSSEPLFFTAWNGCLAFASELRDLLRLLPRRPSPDRVAAAQWLGQGFLWPGHTFFDGVRRLHGGHLLRIGSTWSEREYWRPRYTAALRLPADAVVDELRAAIETSVRRRLAENGSTGVLVSGGMDSSTVLAAAARQARGKVSAYSIVFPDHETMDESSLIDSLIDGLEVPSSRVEVRGGSPLAESLALLRRFEIPWHSPNLIISLPVMRAARSDGVNLLLDGEGGDELFGLARYLVADHVRRARLVSAFRLTARIPDVGDDRRLQRRILREWGLKGAVPHWVHSTVRRLRRPDRHVHPWLNPESARLCAESDDTWSWKRLAGPRWWAYLSYMLTTWRETMGHDGLRRRAEYVGVESGHPFLDDLDLIELVLRIPPELLFHPTFNRPLLREATRGLLPDEIRLRRDKSDLTGLFLDCLAERDWPAVMRLLGTGEPEVGSFVSIPAMRRNLLEVAEPGRRGAWGLRIWRLLTLECWLRQQSDASFADRLLDELAQPAGSR